MCKYTKELVIEQLAQRDLSHLFNEADFNFCLRKVQRNGNGGNKVIIALTVFDMFMHELKESSL